MPLRTPTVKSIAIIGSASVAKAYNPNGNRHWDTGDYYSGGGSGHVVAANPVTALDGIKQRALALGVEVMEATSDDANDATDKASKADVAIVVGGTSSGESTDRKNLNLDNGADDLIMTVAMAAKKTVVLLQIPGVVMMPWRDNVSAVAAMFLGGQETGHAWAANLFGDHAPEGRLPVQIPASLENTINPGNHKADVVYSEGQATSYRNVSAPFAYPFGHGLTYTTFAFDRAQVVLSQGQSGASVHVVVKNTGKTAAVAVPQLYVRFPSEAGHPAGSVALKGFEKTATLQPGASETVTFTLEDRDLSYWNANAWHKVDPSKLQFLVGSSSADLKLASAELTPLESDIVV